MTSFQVFNGLSWATGKHPLLYEQEAQVSQRPRDASCLSVVSFNIPTAQGFFITSYCGSRKLGWRVKV